NMLSEAMRRGFTRSVRLKIFRLGGEQPAEAEQNWLGPGSPHDALLMLAPVHAVASRPVAKAFDDASQANIEAYKLDAEWSGWRRRPGQPRAESRRRSWARHRGVGTGSSRRCV